MAANRRKTIEYAFPTRTIQLATNTTLGTATRYDTSAINLPIPETTSRSFKSVRLVATYHSEYAATNSITGWRMGIQLGVAATSDTDRAGITAINTVSKNVYDVVDLDVTSYFNSNYGAGTSQNCVASLAVSTTTAANINNVTFKLVITYEFDATAHTTRIKTVRIPIQSQITTLTTSQLELGTDSTNPAPANQIPALDTFLPEASKTYRQIFLELQANTASTTTTAFTPFIQIDATAEVGRATIDETLATTKVWRDLYDLTGLITTNAAHALKMRCDLTGRMASAGAVLVVTYEYDVTSTTTMMCEAIVPLTTSIDDAHSPFGNLSFSANVAADQNVLVALLDIPESNPALAQCGLMLYDARNSSQTTNNVRAAAQSYRGYLPVASGGEVPFVHRCDQGSGWSVARGANRLLVNVYSSAVASRGDLYGYAIVNYTADKPSDPDAATHPTNYFGVAFGTTNPQTVDIATGTARVPVLGSPYKLQAAFLAHYIRASSTENGQFYIEQRASELDAQGFVHGGPQAGLVNTSSFFQMAAFTRAFNVDTNHTGKLNIETDRRIARYSFTALHFSSWSWWLTYHQLAFAVAGAVTVDGAAVADGKTVKIFALDSVGNAELVATTTTGGGTGSFSANALDATRTYWASYKDSTILGRSDDGTAGTSTFNVAISTGGSSDVTPPTASATFPASADYQVAKDGSVSIPVVDAANTLGLVVISVKFSDRLAAELVYAGSGGDPTGFAPAYSLYSAIAGSGAAGVGYTFNVRRDSSWPKGMGAVFSVKATDSKGNVLQ